MDDLAPAAAQRTSDDGGQKELFPARKKAPKKVRPESAREPDTQSHPNPEPDHTLDVLA